MPCSLHRLFSVSAHALLLLLSLSLAACSSPEEKAQGYLERGNQYLAKHDYVKAGIEFKNALQLNKNMVAAWRGLLQVEEHSKKVRSWVPILRNIVELDHKDIDARLRLGKLLLAGNALDQALDLANAATKLDPKNASAAAFRGAVLFKLDDPSGAESEAQKALALDPKNPEALMVLAAMSVKHGDLKGALALLDRESVAHEKNLGIQLFKLDVLRRMKDTTATESLLQKLVEQYPDTSVFRRALVGFYIGQGRLDDAERQLRAISSQKPADVNAGLNVVRFLLQHKGPSSAQKELEARIHSKTGTFQYKLALVDFKYSQGHVDDSIKLLQEMLADKSLSREEILKVKLAMAQIQLRLKNNDAANLLISEVLNSDRRNIQGLKLRASLMLSEGRPDDAIIDLREAMNDQPRSSDLMLLLATAYERAGSIDLAGKQYVNATQVSNFNPSVALKYVGFLQRRGDVKTAEITLNEINRRFPNNLTVLTALSEVKLRQGDWNGAQSIGNIIQRIKGGKSVGGRVVAASLSGQGKYEESIQLLESLHTSAPAATQPIAALVNTMLHANQFDQAVSFLRKVLKENPKNAGALVLLGTAEAQKNATEEAIKNFRAAIESQPKNPRGYLALARLYLDQKKLDDSEKTVRAGLKKLPDNLDLRLALASALEVQGKYDEAMAEYEGMLKRARGSLIVANNLASLLSDHRTDKESLERAYTLAVMLRRSDNPAFKDTLGWVHYMRGDTENALPLLEDAAKMLPNVALVRFHLGMCYQAMGKTTKAAEQFSKALKLQPDDQLAAKIRAADARLLRKIRSIETPNTHFGR